MDSLIFLISLINISDLIFYMGADYSSQKQNDQRAQNQQDWQFQHQQNKRPQPQQKYEIQAVLSPQEYIQQKKQDDDESYFQNQKVLQSVDRRKQVQRTNEHPFNGVGLVKCTYIDPETGKQFQQIGTGFIVGKNTVITCLHVVYFSELQIQVNDGNGSYINKQINANTFAHDIQFYHESMMERYSRKQKGLRVEKFYYNKNCFEKDRRKAAIFDWIVLKIEPNNVIKPNNILEIDYNYSLRENLNRQIMICGYRLQKNKIWKQFYEQRMVNAIGFKQRDGYLYQRLSTSQGNSGGPVLIKINGSRYKIIGIHQRMHTLKNQDTNIKEQWNRCISQLIIIKFQLYQSCNEIINNNQMKLQSQ